MPLTLKDIAKMVGVAESTVSRAINNKPGVGAETRKEILKIARKYNYRPNQLAQGLAKKETHILALLLPDLKLPIYPEIISGVEKVANQKDYRVILCNTDNDIGKEKDYLDLLIRNQVDGAIIVGGELTDEHIVNTVLRGNNLIVLINRLTEEVLIPTVLVDRMRGAYLGTAHLLECGREKIGLIMGEKNHYSESAKLDGYKKALAERGLSFNSGHLVTGADSREDGYQAFLKLMELPDPPRGFFVSGETQAIGLIEAIKMGGYMVPEDFSVVVYGESILSSVVDPPLTAVAEPLEMMGELAAEHIICLIEGNPPEKMIKVVEPELKVRGSTG